MRLILNKKWLMMVLAIGVYFVIPGCGDHLDNQIQQVMAPSIDYQLGVGVDDRLAPASNCVITVPSNVRQEDYNKDPKKYNTEFMERLKEINKEASGAKDTQYHTGWARNRAELKEKLSISTDVNVKYLSAIGASFHGDYEKDVEDNKSEFTMYADAYFVKKTDNLEKTGFVTILNAYGWRALQSGIENFYKNCGIRFVSAQSRGARYTMYYHFSQAFSKFTEKLDASMEAKGTNGAFSGSLNAKLSSFISSVAEKNSVTCSKKVNGFTPTKLSCPKLEELDAEMQSVMNAVSAENENLILLTNIYKEYTTITAVTDKIKEEELQQIVASRIDDNIKRLYSEFVRNEDVMKRINILLSLNSTTPRIVDLGKNDKTQMESQVEKLTQLNSKISDRIFACNLNKFKAFKTKGFLNLYSIDVDSDDFIDKKCSIKGITSSSYEIPTPKHDYRQLIEYSIDTQIRNPDGTGRIDLVVVDQIKKRSYYINSNGKLRTDLNKIYLLKEDPTVNTLDCPSEICREIGYDDDVTSKAANRTLNLCPEVNSPKCSVSIVPDSIDPATNRQGAPLMQLVIFNPGTGYPDHIEEYRMLEITNRQSNITGGNNE